VGLSFFLLGLAGEVVVFCLFPMCSLRVCDSTSFLYHLLFGHGSTSMYVTCKLRKGSTTKHASFLRREVASFLGFYVVECPMFQKD